jgi:hypothetical protein
MGYLGPVGTRLRLRSQTAATFMAWSPEKQSKAWIESRVPPLSDPERDEMLGGMAFAREHGFIAIVRTGAVDGGADAVLGTETSEVSVALAAELRDGQSYSLAALVAPVFEPKARVAFALGLAGFKGSLSSDEVWKVARHLTDACGRVSAFIAGEGRPDAIKPAIAA